MDAWQRRCTYAYASRIHAFRSSTYIGIPPLRARRPGVIGGCRDECSGEAGGNTRHTLMVAAKEQRLLVNGEVAAGRKELLAGDVVTLLTAIDKEHQDHHPPCGSSPAGTRPLTA